MVAWAEVSSWSHQNYHRNCSYKIPAWHEILYQFKFIQKYGKISKVDFMAACQL